MVCRRELRDDDAVVEYVQILKRPTRGKPGGTVEGHHDFVHARCDPDGILGWRRVAAGTLDDRLHGRGDR
jgi:hypothetical protein